MIEVINRELLIPREEYNIGTCYDDNTETRHFHLKRVTSSGIDLAALTFNLDIQYADGNTDAASLVKEVTDKDINLVLTINNSMLQVPGTVLIQIRALDEDGVCKWTSYKSAFFVEDHINTPGHYEGDITQLEQYEAEWGKVRDNVNQLNSRMDEVVKIHDETPATEVEEEVIDGRVGYDGTQYDSFGTAVRKQIEDVYEAMEDDTGDWTAAVAAEATARQTADATLQSNINSEASTRATNDASLQSQINQIVAPSGEAPSAAEVQNARIGADGVTYSTLGEAIRGNDGKLKNTKLDKDGYLTLDTSTTHTGKLYNVNTGEENDYAQGVYKIIDINPLETPKIYINGLTQSGVNSFPLVAFFSENTLICKIGTADTEYSLFEVDVPFNATKAIINGRGTSINSIICRLYNVLDNKNQPMLFKLNYNSGQQLFYVYVKSPYSDKYTKYIFYNPTLASINYSCWRLWDIRITNKDLTDLYSLIPTGMATPETSIECEGAIKEEGADDFIGGYHGDEYMDSCAIFVDGREITLNTDIGLTPFYDKIELLVNSHLNRCNTSTAIFKRSKIDTISKDGLTVKNVIKALENVKIFRYPASMLNVPVDSYSGTNLISKFYSDANNKMITIANMSSSDKDNLYSTSRSTAFRQGNYNGNIVVSVALENVINGKNTRGFFQWFNNGAHPSIKTYNDVIYDATLTSGEWVSSTSRQSIWAK